MAPSYAEQRFLDAVTAFRAADERWRAEGLAGLDAAAFDAVASDLDTISADLSGLTLGRALVFRANALYLVHLRSLLDSPTASLAEVALGTSDPRMAAAAESARRGIAILRADDATPRDLAW